MIIWRIKSLWFVFVLNLHCFILYISQAKEFGCSSDSDCGPGLFCGSNKSCTPIHCRNGILDADETDVDCGGKFCTTCSYRKHCLVDSDCSNDFFCDVEEEICLMDSCRNSVLDGNETDVDCGGLCVGCEVGQTCKINQDCTTNFCNPVSLTCSLFQLGASCTVDDQCNSSFCDKICRPKHCSNGIKDVSLNETGIDCGGSCQDCGEHSICSSDDDCANGLLCLESGANHFCFSSTCSNGMLDLNETETDCGQQCPKCDDYKKCSADSDCLSDLCSELSDTCLPKFCADGLLTEGLESDVDCGGQCDPCPNFKKCHDDYDCESSFCEEEHELCLRTQCSDGIRNGNESDVDCGSMSSGCLPCENYSVCITHSDCHSHFCNQTSGLCTEPFSSTFDDIIVSNATCTDNVRNQDETDVDCGGEICEPCPLSKRCVVDEDCATGVCGDDPKICLPEMEEQVFSLCSNGELDGNETDIDCGGNECEPCSDVSNCLKDSDCISNHCDDDKGLCLSKLCFDNIMNADETDVDCGGSCALCDIAQKCQDDSDCASDVCLENQCIPSHCRNGRKDRSFDESDVDCGGLCGKCRDNQVCAEDSDCYSNLCLENVCTAFQCANLRWDLSNNETDIDCGGSTCPPCSVSQKCVIAADCESGTFCFENVCVPTSCFDRKLNFDESDVDCGGSLCPKCLAGRRCLSKDDCKGSICFDGACMDTLCIDGILNGNETDIDCGGNSCPKCVVGAICNANSDCMSGNCDPDTSTCRSSLCSDGLQNGRETDLDCGGTECARCGVGRQCQVADDCLSGVCDSNALKCVPESCNNDRHDLLETDVDCGGDTCAACADGLHCLLDSDCFSSYCSNVTNLCVPESCFNNLKDRNETDVDCGGRFCEPCGLNQNCYSNKDCNSDSFCETNFAIFQCFPQHCNNDEFDEDKGEADVDCGGACKPCAYLQNCESDEDCFSSRCLEGTCVDEYCGDNVLNANETDVDCGGPMCLPCGQNQMCIKSTDCNEDLYCDSLSSSCVPKSCSNGVKDGNETDIDCGGAECQQCESISSCIKNSDCKSNFCKPSEIDEHGKCAPLSCFNEILDFRETDVDCGGEFCPPCERLATCIKSEDCSDTLNLSCVDSTCIDSHCANGIKDFSETDVDCGGDDCYPCVDRLKCVHSNDCESGFCDTVSQHCFPQFCSKHEKCGEKCRLCKGLEPCSNDSDCIAEFVCELPLHSGLAENARTLERGTVCLPLDDLKRKLLLEPPSCFDLVKNNLETSVDCGGLNCSPCDYGSVCKVDTDCGVTSDMICGLSQTCVHEKCNNEILDIDLGESDIDCGGEICDGCEDGSNCKSDLDCLSRICSNGKCSIGTCNDNVLNEQETGVDCGGSECKKCALGEGCLASRDCQSEFCDVTKGICTEKHCGNLIQDATETGVDCGGSSCRFCALANPRESCEGKDDCPEDAFCSTQSQICRPYHCQDKTRNLDETGIDCGGEFCDKCNLLETCEMSFDCASGFCSRSQVCRPKSCSDEQQNFNESDIDCGGFDCEKCSLWSNCERDSDCQSGSCVLDYHLNQKKCLPQSCSNGVQDRDETDMDCGGKLCTSCRDGQMCTTSDDCINECDLVQQTCVHSAVFDSSFEDCSGRFLANVNCIIPGTSFVSCDQHWLDEICDDNSYDILGKEAGFNFNCPLFDFDSRACKFTVPLRNKLEGIFHAADFQMAKEDGSSTNGVEQWSAYRKMVETVENGLVERSHGPLDLVQNMNSDAIELLSLDFTSYSTNFEAFDTSSETDFEFLNKPSIRAALSTVQKTSCSPPNCPEIMILCNKRTDSVSYREEDFGIEMSFDNSQNTNPMHILSDLRFGCDLEDESCHSKRVTLVGDIGVKGTFIVDDLAHIVVSPGSKVRFHGTVVILPGGRFTVSQGSSFLLSKDAVFINFGRTTFGASSHDTLPITKDFDSWFSSRERGMDASSIQGEHLVNFGVFEFHGQNEFKQNTKLLNLPWGRISATDGSFFKEPQSEILSAIVLNWGKLSTNDFALNLFLLNKGLLVVNGACSIGAEVVNKGSILVEGKSSLSLVPKSVLIVRSSESWEHSESREALRKFALEALKLGKLRNIPKKLLIDYKSDSFEKVGLYSKGEISFKGTSRLFVSDSILVDASGALFFSDDSKIVLKDESQIISFPLYETTKPRVEERLRSNFRFSDRSQYVVFSKYPLHLAQAFKSPGNGLRFISLGEPEMQQTSRSLDSGLNSGFGSSSIGEHQVHGKEVIKSRLVHHGIFKVCKDCNLVVQSSILVLGDVQNEGTINVEAPLIVFAGNYRGHGSITVKSGTSILFLGTADVSGPINNLGEVYIGDANQRLISDFQQTGLVNQQKFSVPSCSAKGGTLRLKFQLDLSTEYDFALTFSVIICRDDTIEELIQQDVIPSIFSQPSSQMRGTYGVAIDSRKPLSQQQVERDDVLVSSTATLDSIESNEFILEAIAFPGARFESSEGAVVTIESEISARDGVMHISEGSLVSFSGGRFPNVVANMNNKGELWVERGTNLIISERIVSSGNGTVDGNVTLRGTGIFADTLLNTGILRVANNANVTFNNFRNEGEFLMDEHSYAFVNRLADFSFHSVVDSSGFLEFGPDSSGFIDGDFISSGDIYAESCSIDISSPNMFVDGPFEAVRSSLVINEGAEVHFGAEFLFETPGQLRIDPKSSIFFEGFAQIFDDASILNSEVLNQGSIIISKRSSLDFNGVSFINSGRLQNDGRLSSNAKNKRFATTVTLTSHSTTSLGPGSTTLLGSNCNTNLMGMVEVDGELKSEGTLEIGGKLLMLENGNFVATSSIRILSRGEIKGAGSVRIMERLVLDGKLSLKNAMIGEIFGTGLIEAAPLSLLNLTRHINFNGRMIVQESGKIYISSSSQFSQTSQVTNYGELIIAENANVTLESELINLGLLSLKGHGGISLKGQMTTEGVIFGETNSFLEVPQDSEWIHKGNLKFYGTFMVHRNAAFLIEDEALLGGYSEISGNVVIAKDAQLKISNFALFSETSNFLNSGKIMLQDATVFFTGAVLGDGDLILGSSSDLKVSGEVMSTGHWSTEPNSNLTFAGSEMNIDTSITNKGTLFFLEQSSVKFSRKMEHEVCLRSMGSVIVNGDASFHCSYAILSGSLLVNGKLDNLEGFLFAEDSQIVNAGEITFAGKASSFGILRNLNLLKINNLGCMSDYNVTGNDQRDTDFATIGGSFINEGTVVLEACTRAHILEIFQSKGKLVLMPESHLELSADSVTKVQMSDLLFSVISFGSITVAEAAIAELDGNVAILADMVVDGTLKLNEGSLIETNSNSSELIGNIPDISSHERSLKSLPSNVAGKIFISKSGIAEVNDAMIVGDILSEGKLVLSNTDGNQLQVLGTFESTGDIDVPLELDSSGSASIGKLFVSGQANIEGTIVVNVKSSSARAQMEKFKVSPVYVSAGGASFSDSLKGIFKSTVNGRSSEQISFAGDVSVSEAKFEGNLYQVISVSFADSSAKKKKARSLHEAEPYLTGNHSFATSNLSSCVTNGLGEMPPNVPCKYPFRFDGHEFQSCAGSGYGGQGFCYFRKLRKIGGCMCPPSLLSHKIPPKLISTNPKLSFVPYFTSGPKVFEITSNEIFIEFTLSKRAKIIVYAIISGSIPPVVEQIRGSSADSWQDDAFVAVRQITNPNEVNSVVLKEMDSWHKYDIYIYLESSDGTGFSDADLMGHVLHGIRTKPSTDFVAQTPSHDVHDLVEILPTDFLSVESNGNQIEYSFRVLKKPTHAVVVEILPPETEESIVVQPNKLTFTAGNWQKPQKVAVSATKGAFIREKEWFSAIDHKISSGDFSFNNLKGASIGLRVIES